jgi:hypothetical protein
MRNAIFGLLLVGMLPISSCHKGPAPAPGGSWTFKGVTYSVTSCVGNDSIFYLTATDSTAQGFAGSVTVAFYNVLPAATGTYTVVNGSAPSQPTQVAIIASLGSSVAGLNYQSTGGNGSQTVHVSISNGKISLTGSRIEMSSTTNSSDSAALSLNINQLQ